MSFREQAAPLLELQEKATKGPWVRESVFGNIRSEICLGYNIPTREHPIVLATVFGEEDEPTNAEEACRNAAFIAAAHPIADLLRAALDENDRLRADLTAAERRFCEAVVATQTSYPQEIKGQHLFCPTESLLNHYNTAKSAALAQNKENKG